MPACHIKPILLTSNITTKNTWQEGKYAMITINEGTFSVTLMSRILKGVTQWLLRLETAFPFQTKPSQ